MTDRPVLQEVRVRDFQSFREEQTIPLDEHVTLIAGRNNVGKSALLRAISAATTQRQGFGPAFKLTLAWRVPTSDLVEVLCPPGDRGITAAWLGEVPQRLLVASFAAPDLRCVGVKLPELDAVTVAPAGGGARGWTNGPYSQSRVGVDEIEDFARNLAGRAYYIGPRRVQQGDRSLIAAPQLLPAADNLAEVLLYLRLRPRAEADAFLDDVRDAFPEVSDITVSGPGEPQSTMGIMGNIVVYFETSQEAVPLRECGTGLEQMIALVLALRTAPRDAVILIDEPQAYLHPHAEQSVLRLLDANRDRQFVVATHSAAMLRSRGLNHARLLTLDRGQTRVAAVTEGARLLSELGVTAADLFLAEKVLWVEGASEVAILWELAPLVAEMTRLDVREMPLAASKFTSRSRKEAESAFRFCSDVVDAVRPLPVEMTFLFDRDEKSQQDLDQLERASSGRSRVLSVREVENFFLNLDLLDQVISTRAGGLGLQPPNREVIDRALQSYLAATDDEQLFPGGAPAAGQRPADEVRASELLHRLYWDLLKTEYDKVKHGRELAVAAREAVPGCIEPLLEILRDAAAGV